MSRREEDFKHRTSIFEGAFRAWSHLGQLDPASLQSKSAVELDPLTNPVGLSGNLAHVKRNADGSARPEYPYEPLPRSGLSHPYVKAIISPWLGPEADNEAVELGLTTLRTWWQHRRKGENKTAVKALGTDKMRVVVDKYTRHFFELAHCLVVNDQAQPPRGLHSKLKILEKSQGGHGGAGNNQALSPATLSAIQTDLTDPNLSPLERMHAAQKRQKLTMSPLTDLHTSPIINIKNKCLPGKIDLPGLAEAVNRQNAARLAHQGGKMSPNDVSSSVSSAFQYGDPNTTPIVYESCDGVLQIVLSVDGITCAHCVKIVETVLRGCNSNKSPISGLLDAAADRDLSSVIIKIDMASNAKRIAFEAARNLSMVGYTAKPNEISLYGKDVDAQAANKLFSDLAKVDPFNFFDWTAPCSCPDSGVFRSECARHSQINSQMYGAFTSRERKANECINNNGVMPYEQPINVEQIMKFDSYVPAPTNNAMPVEPLSLVGQAAQNTPQGFGGDTRASIRFSALSIDWENLDEALDYEDEGGDTAMMGDVNASARQVSSYPDGASYSV